ncbi:MAG: glycerophosphodiester phosphodiesterase [Candidatus Freyarchaeota archaeon]
MRKTLMIAHRGASFYEPENTLRAIERALGLGVDGVEIDVRSSVNGNIVVIHDETVDRTTNGTGKVANMSLLELRSLDAGRGERIPLLSEVLETVGNRAMLVIELKVPGIEERVIETLEKQDALGSVTVTSFLHRSVKRVKEINPGVRTGIIFSSSPVNPSRLALDADADTLFARHKYVTPDMVRNAHENGLDIYAWTVDDAITAEKLILMGVDGIVTNKPDVLKR